MFGDDRREIYLHIAIACVGIVAALLLLVGCAEAWYETPGGIRVDTDAVDLARVDAEWKTAADCWGWPAAEIDGQQVHVMHCPITCQGGTQCWGSGGHYYAGFQYGKVVDICPDLAALRHEFSHRICQLSGGRGCGNGAGRCWL